MFHKRFFKIFGVACIAVLAVAGCRPEEQGRLIKYEPGTYQGKKASNALGEEALADLRQRSLMQGGIPAGAGSGGGGPTRGGDVRPPLNEETKQLIERGKLQGGN